MKRTLIAAMMILAATMAIAGTWSLDWTTAGGVGPTLRLWLEFDAGADPQPDSSTYGNDAAVSGATWTNAVSGAMSFGGTTDKLTVTDATTIDMTEDVTISFWANRDVIDSVDRVMDKNTDGVTIYFSTDEKIYIAKKGVGGIALSTGAYAASAWHHYAFVYDHSEGTSLVIVDGQDVTSASGSFPFANNASDLYIGNSYSASQGFDGFIDDVRLYADMLSTSTISNDLYVATKATYGL